ncbi:MAG: hypothetical protein ACOZHQ_06230 [Thermodesulfobacteriota bacterium]
MDPELLWSLLREVAKKLGVRVRLESLDGGEEWASRGGLCRLGGDLVAFVDRRQDALGRARQLGQALRGLDLDGVYLKPALRQFLAGLDGPAAEDD